MESKFKSKVAILCASDLSRMTMASVYTEYLENNNIPYDIIYVDKYKDASPFGAAQYYPYNVEGYENAPFPIKLMHYWKMRKFVAKLLKENQYEFVIVWGELAAFLFADILKKSVPNKFCINIRDYFYNHIFFVQNRLKLAINNSRFFTVSSEAYLDFLPKGNSIVMHSLNKKLLADIQPVKNLRDKEEPIRILYIGLIARLPYAYKMIDELGNDSRYELIFAGIGSEQIDSYIEGKNLTNIKTYGKFPATETNQYLKKADIIYNLYGYDNRHFDLALSIKLYYAISMNIPIMVFDGTFTGKVAEKCGIAFTLHGEEYDNLGDRLYQWYHRLSLEEISEKCYEFLKEVDQSQSNLIDSLDEIFKTE
ncbi:MAG: hypothetical protein IKK24_04910 [Clostridia bacterium]|nr:hypothetical protein [Clostridia bacterium]